jgi:hypothetical protein
VQGEELKMVANFTDKEVSAILQIFAKLDSDGTGATQQLAHNEHGIRPVSPRQTHDKPSSSNSINN